jgi:glutamate-1-semialdehyde 2,1-aminomutase
MKTKNNLDSTADLKSSKYLPGGLNPLPTDTHIVRGLGGKCWDQNDKSYIDFICACGPLVLGHCNSEVNQAAIEQMGKGMIFPFKTPLQEELALVLKNLFPHTPQVRLMKTGSEAVSASIRLARAYTKRSIIIRCGFHGWHDQVISPDVSWHRYDIDSNHPRLIPGVPIPDHPLVISWNGESLAELDRIFVENDSNIAALILDPVQIREPLEANLKAICELTHRRKSLFILDEVKTGFRVDLRGVQGLYNVQPDLSVFSKAIANGFPLAALLVSEKIAGLVDSTQIMGTYNGELVSIAAALKNISILEKPDSIPWLWYLGQKLIDGINRILNQHQLIDDIQAVPYRWPCMPYIWFHQNSEIAQTIKPCFYEKLIQRGILLFANHMNFVCLAHSLKDIEETLEIVDSSLKDCLSTYNYSK